MTFYHGTRRGFTKRGILVPRSQHGGPGTSAPATRQYARALGMVHATEIEELAWVYAWHAPGRGRPKVLVLEPHGMMEPDPEHSPEMKAWSIEWATVVDVLTEPLVTEQEAREGWTTQGS